jgi:hypothetical protein
MQNTREYVFARVNRRHQRISISKILSQIFNEKNVDDSKKVVNMIAISSLSLVTISKVNNLELFLQHLVHENSKATIQILDRDVRILLQQMKDQTASLRLVDTKKRVSIRHMSIQIVSLHVRDAKDEKKTETFYVSHHELKMCSSLVSIKTSLSKNHDSSYDYLDESSVILINHIAQSVYVSHDLETFLNESSTDSDDLFSQLTIKSSISKLTMTSETLVSISQEMLIVIRQHHRSHSRTVEEDFTRRKENRKSHTSDVYM